MADHTCATCVFIQRSYWGDASDFGGRTHFCGKSAERRRDTMKPTGDFAEDFMRNFRAFFDAKANQKACRYFEERGLADAEQMAILHEMASNNGKAAYGFFSNENRLCGQMDGKFVERDESASYRRSASDGTRDWMLTEVGKAEVSRAALAPSTGAQDSAPQAEA